jgi:hypothetical protein
VGGGYPEDERGLSKIALAWMLKEAVAAGLLTEPARIDLVLGKTDAGYVKPNALAHAHESLTLAWWPAEFVPKRHYNWATRKDERRANLFRRRTIPDGALIHQSAFDRGKEYAARLPKDPIVESW